MFYDVYGFSDGMMFRLLVFIYLPLLVFVLFMLAFKYCFGCYYNSVVY